MSQPLVWHPPRAVLELAELVLTGALPQLPEPFRLPDDIAAGLVGPAEIVLEDAEGTPVALVRAGSTAVEPRKPFSSGPLRSARRVPAEVRAALPPGPVIAVPVAGSLSLAEVGRAVRAAAGGSLLWLVLVGAGRRVDLPAGALLRAVQALVDDGLVDGAERVDGADGAAGWGCRGVVLPVALPAGVDPIPVARAYGATEVLTLDPAGSGPPGPVLHPAFRREQERALPPPHRRGLTVFFTGLSGSGKSTVARGLADRLDGVRTISQLDGDEVRRLLSAGLGFSPADRDLNIRRIGFVAAEIGRHGGLAICAPIAPFAHTRAAVREMVEEHGDFLLIHVSTPLAECERRDRKGLYAKARAGEIPQFTGISSPYEVPVDADLRLDTSRMSVHDAVGAVHHLLAARGYLGPPAPVPA